MKPQPRPVRLLTLVSSLTNDAVVPSVHAVVRLTATVYPNEAEEGYTYDDHGRLATRADRRGIVTTYAYDALGRLASKTYSNGDPPVAYTYDVAGRLESASNGTDTLSWTYDLGGQVLSETSQRNGSTVSYTYDTAGNRASLSLDGQLFASYAYDDAGRLTGITRSGQSFGFAYDAANRRTSMTYPNGVVTSYAYDELDRLTSLQAVHAGITPITSFTYTHDAAGNRTSKATLDFTEAYGYDDLDRLTAVDRTGPQTGLWRYAYDPVGNRTTAQADQSLTTSSYDVSNRLLSTAPGGALRVRGTLDEPGTVTVNGQPAAMLPGNVFEASVPVEPGARTITVQATDHSGNTSSRSYDVAVSGTAASYTYDSNGNLASKTEGTDNWVYSWNAENQLTKVEKNGAEVARFAYDPTGRRVEKAAGGLTTGYTYDGDSILRELRGNATLKYVHGHAVDEPLAVEEQAVLTYLHADGLGSIVKATNAAGAVAFSREYDAWGTLQSSAEQPGYSFTGREWDPEMEFYYYRARYYDPRAGRFVAEDPVRFTGGVNFFAYALGNPLRFIDPSGLQSAGVAGDRTCWVTKWHNGDSTLTCSDDHNEPPSCVSDGNCEVVPDPCPRKRDCWVDWDFFWPCFWSGNNVPGAPPPPDRRNPPNPPDRPGTRGNSAGGAGGRAGVMVLNWLTGCLEKAKRCGYVPGKCAPVYCGAGKK